jgi:hypothetical protein
MALPHTLADVSLARMNHLARAGPRISQDQNPQLFPGRNVFLTLASLLI